MFPTFLGGHVQSDKSCQFSRLSYLGTARWGEGGEEAEEGYFFSLVWLPLFFFSFLRFLITASRASGAFAASAARRNRRWEKQER